MGEGWLGGNGNGDGCFEGDVAGEEGDVASRAARSSFKGRIARRLLTVEDICSIDV